MFFYRLIFAFMLILPGTVCAQQPLNFTGYFNFFDGTAVGMADTVIDESVLVMSDSLKTSVSFTNVTFKEDVTALAFQVEGNTEVNNCEFNGTLDLAMYRSTGKTRFWECRFGSNLDLFYSIGLDEEDRVDSRGLTLYGSTVDSVLRIYNPEFREGMKITACTLNEWRIRNVTMPEPIYISRSYLGHYGEINECDLDGGVQFFLCTLPDTLDLSDVRLGPNARITIKECFLDSARHLQDPNYRCLLNLYGTDLSKVDFPYPNFKLYIDPEKSFERNTSIYQSLLHQFRQLNYEESYELLDREYKEYDYLYANPEHPNRLMNWLDDWWWGYGYNKEKIVRNTFIILFIFVILNNLFLKGFLTHVYDLKDISQSAHFKKNWERLNPVVRFFWFLPTSIFVTSLIFFGLKFELDRLSYGPNLGWKRIPRLAWFILIYLSGIFCLAYLANFVLNQ